jgi:hypothetical protein
MQYELDILNYLLMVGRAGGVPKGQEDGAAPIALIWLMV